MEIIRRVNVCLVRLKCGPTAKTPILPLSVSILNKPKEHYIKI